MADKDITNRDLLTAMTQQLAVITDNMVTKQDLKEELKRFATKNDLKRLEDNMNRRFKGVDRRFQEVDQRFANADQRFDKMDHRFDKVDQRFDKMDQRFDKVDRRFDKMDHRFDRLERQVRSNHTVNVAHHLETRSMVGDLYRKNYRREEPPKAANRPN